MSKLKNDELAERADFSSENKEEPPTPDVEREPVPDAAPDAASNIITEPPARSGPGSEATQMPTEGTHKDNPVHHTGRMPPPRAE